MNNSHSFKINNFKNDLDHCETGYFHPSDQHVYYVNHAHLVQYEEPWDQCNSPSAHSKTVAVPSYYHTIKAETTTSLFPLYCSLPQQSSLSPVVGKIAVGVDGFSSHTVACDHCICSGMYKLDNRHDFAITVLFQTLREHEGRDHT